MQPNEHNPSNKRDPMKPDTYYFQLTHTNGDVSVTGTVQAANREKAILRVVEECYPSMYDKVVIWLGTWLLADATHISSLKQKAHEVKKELLEAFEFHIGTNQKPLANGGITRDRNE